MKEGPFYERFWTEIGGEPAEVRPNEPSDADVQLHSPLPVGQLAYDSVAAASAAADLVATSRDRGAHPRRESRQLDSAAIATAFTSERHLRIDGEPVSPWAALSGFWSTAGTWVRTHANYPHHDRSLRRLLGLSESDSGPALEAALASTDATRLELAAHTAGAVAVAVRTIDEWRSHPQARPEGDPWLRVTRRLDARPRPWWEPAATTVHGPLSGVRVLDLTRVIAGPVAGRTLALAGADVLRIDPPNLFEPPWQHQDTGQLKRSAFLDFNRTPDRRRLEALVSEADVVLVGYSQAMLERWLLTPTAVAHKNPGLVVGRVRAWAEGGPWASRRGFDSIVQAATGIAMAHSLDGDAPGALPAQALDHSTGYFLAAAVMDAVRRQRQSGGTHTVSISLQRTAEILLASASASNLDRPVGATGATFEPVLNEMGPITCAAPCLGFGGVARVWPRGAQALGESEAEWLQRVG